MLVLTVVLAPSTGCRRFDPAEPTDEVRDFTGRGGRYTRSAFLSDSRGWVFFNVYLPPGWSPDGPEAYPLIIFLHGQMGDEHRFTDNVRASQLNGWIENGSVAPFVLIAPRGADRRGAVQWYYSENERLLTSEEDGELRAYARRVFRAGLDGRAVSLHGHSRGASGTLYFALSHSDKFASAVANAFVSDYVLERWKSLARQNRDQVLASGIPLRMTIGTRDHYVTRENRKGSSEMHEHLQELGVPHEYEVLEGVTHGFSSLWRYRRPDGKPTGLHELQFHARSWER
jgi:enterochelin esterase-like enzyme